MTVATFPTLSFWVFINKKYLFHFANVLIGSFESRSMFHMLADDGVVELSFHFISLLT